MKIKINPKTFISEFINPALEVNKEGKLVIQYDTENDELYAYNVNNSSTVKLFNTYKCAEISDPVPTFAMDTKKLIRGLSCLDNSDLLIDLDIDFSKKELTYKSKELQFFIKLLSERAYVTPKFNLSSFKNFKFDKKIMIDSSNVKAIHKALEFSSETGKFYLEQQDGEIYFYFGDRNSTSNDTDSMRILIGKDTDDIPVDKFIYDVDLLKFVLKYKTDFSMNFNPNGVMFIEIENNNTKLKYITSPLLK